MSEISEMMPLVSALLKSGQMPSADQVRRMLVVIDKQSDEIDRLTGLLASTLNGEGGCDGPGGPAR